MLNTLRHWTLTKVFGGKSRDDLKRPRNPIPTLKEYYELLKERSTERAEKEFYFLVGGVLVKTKLEGMRREKVDASTRFTPLLGVPCGRVRLDCGQVMGFTCRVLEIDGVSISADEQEEKLVSFESVERSPTRGDQYQVIVQALEKFGLNQGPVQVSEAYVSGHLKVLALRQRVGERR